MNHFLNKLLGQLFLNQQKLIKHILDFRQKPSFTNDTKRRGISPLVHDTKSSFSKREEYNSDDDDEDLYSQAKI